MTARRLRRTCSRSTGACSRSPEAWRPAIAIGGRGPARTPATPTLEPSSLGRAERTRFAPAPTGFLHPGHVANAIWVWGAARLSGATVLLRVEDHDRHRSRSAFDAAILQDLARLGFVADAGPVRQTDPGARAACEAALAHLTADGLVYRCACTRSTFAAWAREHGRDWSGVGCPGACRNVALPGDAATSLRVALGAGSESFTDVLLGEQSGSASTRGDLIARDHDGNWTYAFAVVVDDLRQGIDLVVRGEDLLPDTARQIRLARLLGRSEPPRFLHHALIRKANGAKLSKSDGDTGVRELLAAGWTPAMIRDEAARRGAIPASIARAAG